MLELRTSGANISRPSINEFLGTTQDWQLHNESYWDQGGAAQVYYMLGAWATAYLIHVQHIDEIVVLKDWYHDIPRIGNQPHSENTWVCRLPNSTGNLTLSFARQMTR